MNPLALARRFSPPKKSKTGLIIALVVVLLILVVGSVILAVVLSTPKDSAPPADSGSTGSTPPTDSGTGGSTGGSAPAPAPAALESFNLVSSQYGQGGKNDKVLRPLSPEQCAQECLKFDGCKSFDSHTGGDCYLSKSVVTDDSQYNKSLSGYSYYEKKAEHFDPSGDFMIHTPAPTTGFREHYKSVYTGIEMDLIGDKKPILEPYYTGMPMYNLERFVNY